MGGEGGISDGHNDVVGIDLPLVDKTDFVSAVGHHQEEGVLLAGGQTVGDDVEADSDEGNILTSANVLD